MLTEQYPSSSEGELNSCERQPQPPIQTGEEKYEEVQNKRRFDSSMVAYNSDRFYVLVDISIGCNSRLCISRNSGLGMKRT